MSVARQLVAGDSPLALLAQCEQCKLQHKLVRLHSLFIEWVCHSSSEVKFSLTRTLITLEQIVCRLCRRHYGPPPPSQS